MKYCSKCGKELPEDAETPFNCPNCGRARVTATPPESKQIFPSKKGRPQGVTVIALLNLIGGVLGTILGLIIVAMFSTGLKFGGLMGTFAAYLSLAGIAMFFVGLFSLFVGWGLWKGAEWAWTLTVILEIIGIISGIMTIMVTPYAVAVLINGLILYYLFKPNVKEWFKKPSEVIIDKSIIKEEKVTEEEKPDPRKLYKDLFNYYSDFYGSGIRFEKELESYIKQGLNRDEAILEIAEKTGFIERVEAANNYIKKQEKPDPINELYGQLLNYYRNLYSSGNRLEREIKHYIKQGLSRDKAILKIAETKGFIEIEQTSM